MAITPVYALPYQAMTDPPHGPNLGALLAQAVEAELQRIDADVDTLGAGPRGVIKRGRRTTSSPTTTGELPVLRVDGISVKAGRIISAYVNTIAVVSSVSGDNAAARLHFTTDGTPATTLSPIMNTGVGYSGSFASSTTAPLGIHIPPLDQTLSVLLSVLRIAGTGNVSALVNSGNPAIDLLIADIGADPTDTGIDL